MSGDGIIAPPPDTATLLRHNRFGVGQVAKEFLEDGVVLVGELCFSGVVLVEPATCGYCTRSAADLSLTRGAGEPARESLEVGHQFRWGFDLELDVQHADHQRDQRVGV